jgi:DNA-binding NarL/FixJ family response regulator
MQMDTGHMTSIFIVAKPGRLRDSLKAMLRTASYLNIVGQADDAVAAIPCLAQFKPDLLLIGTNLPAASVTQLVVSTKGFSPHTRCMVLVDNLDQMWQATVAGADSVLLAGFPSTTFFSAIEGLRLQTNV